MKKKFTCSIGTIGTGITIQKGFETIKLKLKKSVEIKTGDKISIALDGSSVKVNRKKYKLIKDKDGAALRKEDGK